MVQAETHKRPRFRINPVEIVIFLLVLGGFGLSLYGLYRQTENLKLSHFGEHNSLRMPASIMEPDALKLDISCSKNPRLQASK